MLPAPAVVLETIPRTRWCCHHSRAMGCGTSVAWRSPLQERALLAARPGLCLAGWRWRDTSGGSCAVCLQPRARTLQRGAGAAGDLEQQAAGGEHSGSSSGGFSECACCWHAGIFSAILLFSNAQACVDAAPACVHCTCAQPCHACACTCVHVRAVLSVRIAAACPACSPQFFRAGAALCVWAAPAEVQPRASSSGAHPPLSVLFSRAAGACAGAAAAPAAAALCLLAGCLCFVVALLVVSVRGLSCVLLLWFGTQCVGLCGRLVRTSHCAQRWLRE